MGAPERKKITNFCRTGLSVLGLAVCVFLLVSCDQATRYKTLTTLFDGVPSLPPAEDLCVDYVALLEVDSSLAEASEEPTGKVEKSGSTHAPYGEKNCGGCHQIGKSNELIKPPTQLCFVCHADFIQGSHIHGPIAVGDCLACHLPHSSRYPALLVKDRSDICSRCHREERLAAGMHERLSARGMDCVECHGAHFGDNQYFLK